MKNKEQEIETELTETSESLASKPALEENDNSPTALPGKELAPQRLQQDVIPQEREIDCESIEAKEQQLDHLTLFQIGATVPGWLTNPNALEDAVQCFLSFGAKDAAETTLALLMVGLTNATMDGLDRASVTGVIPEVRQMELKLAQKGSAAVVDVLRALRSHRNDADQKLSVANVNVNSGGQAILGNIRSTTRSEKDEE